MRAPLPRARLRARRKVSRTEPRGERHRSRLGIGKLCLDLLDGPRIVSDEAAPDVEAVEEHATAPEVVTAERLVKTRHRLKPKQPPYRQHVERNLKLAVGAPVRPIVLGTRPPALVVTDGRVASAVDIHTVDDPANPHIVAESQGR
jgi:hypothetical protein